MAANKKILLGGAALLALTSLTIESIKQMPRAQAHHTPGHGQQMLIAQNQMVPITIVFPSRSGVADLQRKANAVARLISNELDTPVEAVVSDETAAVEALRANRANVAFLSSRPALKAQQLAKARLYLAEVRSNYSGGHTYRSVMVVRQNSPLRTKANSKQTLEQLRGKRMAFTSPTSGSGFVFPVGEFVRQGFVPNRDRLNGFFGQVTYGGDYSKALQAVLRGQADVAAVSEYALKPPYITAEEGKQLRVLYAVSGVPAHGVAIDDSVPAPQRTKLINALMKLNQPGNNKLLRDLYNSTQLVRVNHDSHLSPMRNALQRAGFQP